MHFLLAIPATKRYNDFPDAFFARTGFEYFFFVRKPENACRESVIKVF